MSYTSGILNRRVTILTRSASSDEDYGRVAGAYTEGSTIWAAVDWSRGTKSMREGALDAYDRIMVRCRYTTELTRESRLRYDGKDWQIDSFHADREENTIQMTCTELMK